MDVKDFIKNGKPKGKASKKLEVKILELAEIYKDLRLATQVISDSCFESEKEQAKSSQKIYKMMEQNSKEDIKVYISGLKEKDFKEVGLYLVNRITLGENKEGQEKAVETVKSIYYSVAKSK